MSIEQLNLAFDIQGLTPGQKVVLLVLANRANKKFEAWPSVDSIVRQTCMSRSGVKNALRKLNERGLLFKITRRNRANVYHLKLVGNPTTRSLCDPDKEEGNFHSVTEARHLVTPKRAVTDPLVVTQYPQTIKNHQVTTIEPKADVLQNLNIEAWNRYEDHRRDLGIKKLTTDGERLAQESWATASKEAQSLAVNDTIANGWHGCWPKNYEDKSSETTKRNYGRCPDETFDAVNARNRIAAGLD